MRQILFEIRRSAVLTLGGALLLAGCSETGEDLSAGPSKAGTASEAMDMAAEAEVATSAEQITTTPLAKIPVSMPKIAYAYQYGFELAGDDIAELQEAHADLCEAQGPYTCRIIAMTQSGEAGENASGRLQLAVAAPKAREFGEKLGVTASHAGGEQVSATIAGEDISKQMVDTEARLRARTALRDRLLEVLRTRRGKVSELVEAERSVARVNEEIDQARSWLEEMRGRVAFSKVDIAYSSAAATRGAFVGPINSALASVGAITGTVIGGIIMLLAFVLPLSALVYLAYILRGLIRRRIQTPALSKAASET